jgi:hypothetical protein
MSEFVGHTDIPCCVDSCVRCLQAIIHNNALLIVLYTCGLEVETFDIRSTADTDKNLINCNELFAAV